MRTEGQSPKRYHEEFYYSAREIIGSREGVSLYEASPLQADLEDHSGILTPSGAKLPDYGYRIRGAEYLLDGSMQFTIGFKYSEPRAPAGLWEMDGLITIKSVERMLYGFEAREPDPAIPYRQIGHYTITDNDNIRKHFRNNPKQLNPWAVRFNPETGKAFGIYRYLDLDGYPWIVVYSTMSEVNKLSVAVEHRHSGDDWLRHREEENARIESRYNDRNNQKIASKSRLAAIV